MHISLLGEKDSDYQLLKRKDPVEYRTQTTAESAEANLSPAERPHCHLLEKLTFCLISSSILTGEPSSATCLTPSLA